MSFTLSRSSRQGKYVLLIVPEGGRTDCCLILRSLRLVSSEVSDVLEGLAAAQKAVRQ